jgi:hypothetical protein
MGTNLRSVPAHRVPAHRSPFVAAKNLAKGYKAAAQREGGLDVTNGHESCQS